MASSFPGIVVSSATSEDQTNIPALEAAIRHCAASNDALRSVVLELADLLRDPSRFASYSTSGVNFESPRSDRSPLVGHKRARSRSVSPLPIGLNFTRHDAEVITVHGTFEEQNERARNRHEERRQREMNRLKSRASYKYVSYPSSFYNTEVQTYHATRRYSAADPHQWWHRLHHPHRPDKTIRPGPHLGIASVGTYRDELLDALFDFESVWPEHLVHTLPLRELEHTYGYKMHRVKSEVAGNHKVSNELIILVGRFFQRLSTLEVLHPQVATTDAAFKKAFSIQRLLDDCRGAGIADRDFTDERLFAHVWQVLRAFNHVAVLPPAPPQHCFDDFILNVLDNCYLQDGIPDVRPFLKPTANDEEVHFSPNELGYKALTELGDLKIKWTNLYSQHLLLSRSSKTLLLFWDVSILGQSALFTHWPSWMMRPYGEKHDIGMPLTKYETKSVKLLEELQRSYRIIFGNHKGRFLERFFRKHFSRSGDEVGIKLDNLEDIMMGFPTTRVDLNRSSARQALKYYLRAPVPKSVLDLRPELDRKRHRGPKRSFIPSVHFKKPTSGKLMDLLDAGPPYPLDFWMHISYLLELSQSSSLSEMEMYSAYPIFGDRMRELKSYMDKQRPGNFKQLLKDRRDTIGYWAFWAVIVVGGLSIILTLTSIAFSSAQTVAAFQALEPLQRNTSAAIS